MALTGLFFYSTGMLDPVTVISLGGSIIAPRGVDAAFLKGFFHLVEERLAAEPRQKLIIVCGGGSLARDYQAALREVNPDARSDDLDWVGVAATRVNGELLRRMLHPWCVEDLVTDPSAVSVFAGRILVAAGWKPGFSTDNDAVVLARRFSSGTVVNLSNIA
jgi:uridylate kinase